MDSQARGIRISYQPSLFHQRTIKRFAVDFGNSRELYDTFEAAHGRAQRLKAQGVRAKVAGVEQLAPA